MAKPPPSFRLPIGTLIVAVTLALSVGTGYFAQRGMAADREAAIRLAEVQSRNLAQAIDQNLSRLIQRVDDALATVVSEVESNLETGELDQARMKHLLASQEHLLPEVLAIRITDAQGRLLLGQPGGQPITLVDRPFFKQVRDRVAGGTLITNPVMGAFVHRWLIISARRYRLPDGRFGGVVTAPIPLDNLQEAMAGFDPGPGGFLELRDDRGAFIARIPATIYGHTHAVGSTKISDRLRDLLQAGTRRETYFVVTHNEKAGRTISFRRLDTAPIVVLAGLAEDDYLALWRRDRIRTVAGVGVFLAGLWGLAAFIWGFWQRREAFEAEQRRLQAQFQQTQKMESLGSLASGIAHDMNNVLGAILVMASTHRELQPDGTTRKAFDTIAQAATRGGKMLNGLLNFARANPQDIRAVDLNAVLRDQVQFLERTTLAKVQLLCDLAPDLPPILGDASALAHAVINLCINAVDAMPDGGTLTLRTRVAADGQVEVQVEDTGVGMNPEVLAKAMDPFFTTKAQGQGTGLGLSMTFRAVHAHQGQIALASTPGQGTCVTLRFPAHAVDASPEPAAGRGGEDRGGAEVTPGPLRGALASPARARDVLLIDDDELIQISVSELLRTLGHRVTPAHSGEEALRKVEAGFVPDLAILDMNMPGLGGAGTLPRLLRLCPGLPVLLATGRVDQTALDLVGNYPGVSLMPKPFDLEQLQRSMAYPT